jgi:8-oxo-dGTP pyrophosphatase MutT (NUDIX family)
MWSARRVYRLGSGLRKLEPVSESPLCYKHGEVKREFSAGGVLVRKLKGKWVLAAIRPAGKKPGLWALPKGNIGPGEDPRETALREVHEETGAHGRLVEKLGDARYTYTWAGERIFKIVSFFLLRYTSGRLGDLPPETAHEVDEVRWLSLDEAPKLLAYGGEREMVERARASVRSGIV